MADVKAGAGVDQERSTARTTAQAVRVVARAYIAAIMGDRDPLTTLLARAALILAMGTVCMVLTLLLWITR
jgi:hypothetical protein